MKTLSCPPSNRFFRPLSLFRPIILFVSLLSSPTITSQTTDNTTETSSYSWKGWNMYENVSMSTVDIIKKNGYAAEIHHVITEDGYILELHRIPSSRSGQKPTRNHPVFFHHAFLSNSAGWVLSGANTSLSMQLADAGYDVWLANSRGNTYSRKHVSLNYKQKSYWNFSLHEIGTYDLPAAFDYILMTTNASQLHYIGYSMGTTVFFIMASTRPEYQSKIRSQISLAPVAYFTHLRSPIRYVAPYARMMNIAYQRLTNGMVLPQTRMKKIFASTVCAGKMMQKLICQRGFIFFICGSDPKYFNTKLIPLIMGHFPSGTSSMVPEHFAQIKLKDAFGRYDYGPVTNMEKYNSTEPPKYDLTSIQVPITLMYGKNDLVADIQDVMKLKSQLPRLIDAVMIDNPYFNHLDFMWSTEVNERVNDPIKETLRKTDDMDWEYSGPNIPQSKDIFNVSGNVSDGYIGSSGNVNISGSGNFNISDSENLNISDSGNVNISGSGHFNISDGENLNISDSGNGNISGSGHFNISDCGNVNISDSGHFNISDGEHLSISDSAGDVGGSGNVSGSGGSIGNVSDSVVPSDLDYFAKNLGKIIADAMPKPMDHEGDAADFERERILQETLLADSIEFVRSVQKKYGSKMVWQESSTRATNDRNLRIKQVVTSPNDAV
ncbi:lipase 3-like [Acyrthosiphon pisum]|uniref:Partial AB-hydrolase lipase domain-containing protein n=1 Tax=Acyrthosiphon pisum TaxID=7029 RepID=A0A8R2B8P7_ACYPI|nr:lipase 3-like [Acyrthosiphon pisum]XP_016662736.1 lipase 3-like [Acyrthosiphon pisum]XP_016662737.1 lipase 3-like [Acyrthosiphon pisum]|eukprot:XP_008186492.2 PREDICTED: lipase 3-like [Acyrthosiphon pisum]